MNQPEANGFESGNGANALIYVVDDEPMLLELAAVVLEPHGFKIKTFRDPQSALQSFASAQPPPVLVITDYTMDNMTGLEFIEACRKVQPRQKILLLSGTVDEQVYRNSPFKPDCSLARPYQAKQQLSIVMSLLADSGDSIIWL